MKESYYLKALEYSSNRRFEGVTFQELRKNIEEKFGKRFTPESLLTFFRFVLDTHYWSDSEIGADPKINLGIIGKFLECFKKEFKDTNVDTSGHQRIFDKFTQTVNFYLNTEGDKRLLDFYELREARINARQAYKISIWAIILSIVAALFSPVLNRIWEYILN